AGGLPGAGWDRSPPQRADGDQAAIKELVAARKLVPIQRQSPTLGAKPPAGAIVLFDGTSQSLEKWQAGARRTEEGWLIPGVTTRDSFRDYSLHAEFQTPFMPKASGQARGNSGIYHQGRYETQILDSFGLEGKNNEAGGIYEVRDPDLNMCLPPLSWQTYDIDFTAARFDAAGKKLADAKLTVRLNGVVVQSDVAVPAPTRAAPLPESNSPGPIHLQDHGNPVRFRNIWLVPRDAEREALRPRVPGFERFFAGYATGNSTSTANIQPSNQPSSEVLGGRLLISQLGCAACHTTDDAGLKAKTAPVLSDVGARVRLDHLVGFIGGPHQTKAGTRMPDLMHHLTAEERASKVAELVSWLAETGKPIDRPSDAAAIARGDELFHTIGCVACHAPRRGATSGAGKSADKLPEIQVDSTSVPLGNLTAKYTLDSLSKFLVNPHAIRASGLMPKLVNGSNEARDVACYLLGEAIMVAGAEQFQATVYHGSWDKLPNFDELKAVKSGTTNGLDLSLATRKNNFAMRFDAYLPIDQAGEYTFYLGSDDGSRLLIDDQEVVKFDGVHPFAMRTGKQQLSVGVHHLRVEYFEQGGEERLELEIAGPGLERSPATLLVSATKEAEARGPLIPNKFRPAASLSARGSQTFQKIGCANCHTLKIGEETFTTKLTAPPLNSLKSETGCLSISRISAGLPDYALSPTPRRAILAALQASQPIDDAASQVHLTMASFNCYACHSRGLPVSHSLSQVTSLAANHHSSVPLGGPETARDAFFKTSVPEMGNEARVPPPLTGVGDKLKPEVLERIVAQGAKDRPYMLTRMPAFSSASGGSASADPAPWVALREQLATLDAVAANPNSIERAPPGAAAEQLVVEGRKLVGASGLACIKCHTYGQRGVPGIQAIDLLTMTERLRPDWFQRYMLAPTDYRPGTRMPLSFPEGKSVLTSVLEGRADAQIQAMWLYLAEGKRAKSPAGLDGQSIVLVAEKEPVIYRNFIEGLGPRGIAVGYPERVNLAWDAGTMNLAMLWKNDFMDASKHWVGRGAGVQGPLGDFVIKLAAGPPLAQLASGNSDWPATPPRDLGYKFLGYRLNSTGQPTFRYSVGDVTVEEFAFPVAVTQGSSLSGFDRRLTITSAQPLSNWYMRLAKGNIQTEADGIYLINQQLRVSVDGSPTSLVPVADSTELRVALPPEARVVFSVKMRW
ncbi:MAG: DUF1080 domain-containing protein, partial [Pirellulaceae bacterium]|nr:DUF1080 domain-containing protein [Pirellulaceae bacterium]